MKVPSILCPQCNTPLDPNARYCSGCGVDMSVITLLLERFTTTASSPRAAPPFVPELLIPRLGEFLVKRQMITEDDLQRALRLQQTRAQEGQPLMLGAALMELGLIAREALDRAIMNQIVELQTALQASNRQLEQRVAERTAALEDAFKKLNKVNQIKANFVSNISHELRTPLAQVKGYAALVSDGILGPLNPEQGDAMRAASKALDRLETLIEDMIRFATAARGELIVNASVFCISDTISSIVNRSAAKAAKANLTVTTAIPAQPIYVQGDAEKLNWVLIQLLDNAIKFTPAGGKTAISLEANVSHRTVRVEVADTGIGIPVERIPELFQAFHQLDASSTRKYGGTGLGLALVREIVEAHSGKINIESELGKGSRFWFELPMTAPGTEN